MENIYSFLNLQTFGREISITFWARFTSFASDSTIFDCGNSHGVDNVHIHNVGTTG